MATEDVTEGGEHIKDDLDPETGPAGHMGENQEVLAFPSNGSLSAVMTAGELGMTSGGAGLGVLTAELDVEKGMDRRALEKTLAATAGSHDAGVLSLYDGVLANILKEAPASALYLGVYEWARAIFLQTEIGSNTLLVYLLAGATGEVVASLIRAPSEGIKTRIQVTRVRLCVWVGRAGQCLRIGHQGICASAKTYLWRNCEHTCCEHMHTVRTREFAHTTRCTHTADTGERPARGGGLRPDLLTCRTGIYVPVLAVIGCAGRALWGDTADALRRDQGVHPHLA